MNRQAVIRLFSTGWEVVRRPKAMCGSDSSGTCSVQPDNYGFKPENLDTGTADDESGDKRCIIAARETKAPHDGDKAMT